MLQMIGFWVDFYPRPPRGGRPLNIGESPSVENISIHALREEGDIVPTITGDHKSNFYPRPPRGGRPFAAAILSESILISIHALREEGDFTRPRKRAGGADFYPRPPRGGRQQALADYDELERFLSTPSARRATPA